MCSKYANILSNCLDRVYEAYIGRADWAMEQGQLASQFCISVYLLDFTIASSCELPLFA